MGNTCRCCRRKIKREDESSNSDVNKTNRLKRDGVFAKDTDSAGNMQKEVVTNTLPDTNKTRHDSENKVKPISGKSDLDSSNIQVVVDTNQTPDIFEYMDVYDMGTQMAADIQCAEDDLDTSYSVTRRRVSSAASEGFENDDALSSDIGRPDDLRMKFVTKGLQIPVYVESKDKDQLNQNMTLQEYCKKHGEMSGWLDKHESVVKSTCELPIPLEPNALQEQIKLVEDMVLSVSSGKNVLDQFSSALENLLSCPRHVFAHMITNETDPKTILDAFQLRYRALLDKTENLSTKLHSTLQQAESVRNQFENLQKSLQDINKETCKNKKTSLASSEVLQCKISDMKEVSVKLHEVDYAMETLHIQCVQLFGSGTSEAGCSLKNTLSNLVALHGSVKHDFEHWNNHLVDMQSKLLSFEANQEELVAVLNEAVLQLNEMTDGQLDESGDLEQVKQLRRTLEENLQKLESLHASLLTKESQYSDTVANGELLLINCCFNSAPVASKVDTLKLKWKEVLESCHNCKNKLDENSSKLNKNQLTLLKIEGWIKSAQNCLTEIIPTLNLEFVKSNLVEVENILEEAKKIQSDSNFQILVHTEVKEQAQDSLLQSFKKCLNELHTAKANLTEVSLDVNKLSRMFDSCQNVLDPLETELIEWKSDLENLMLVVLSEKNQCHEQWMDKVCSNRHTFEELENTMMTFRQSHSSKSGFKAINDIFDGLVTRWKTLLQTCDELHQNLLSKCKAHLEYCEKHQRFVEWLQDKRTIYSMLDVSCSDVSVFEKQCVQLQALTRDVESHETHLEDLGVPVKILPALDNMHGPIKADWQMLKQDLLCLSAQHSESLSEIKALLDLLNELCSWSKTICSKIEGTKLQCDVVFLEKEMKNMDEMRNKDFVDYEQKCKDCVESASRLLEINAITNSLHSDITAKAKDAFHNAMGVLDKHEKLTTSTKLKMEQVDDSCKHIIEAMKTLSVELCAEEERAHLTVTDVEVYLQTLQGHLDTVNSKIADHKQTKSIYEEILKSCDCESYTTLVEDARTSLTKTHDRIRALKESLQNCKMDIGKFYEMANGTENRLNGIEMKINLTKEMSGLTTKQIKFSQEIHNDLCDEASSILALCDFAKQLSGKTHNDTPQSIPHISACEGPLIEKANTIAEKFQELKLNTAELQSNLEHILKFENEICEASEKLQSLENEVDGLDPISREQKQLSVQQESSNVLLHRAQELNDHIVDLDGRYMSYSEGAFGMSNHERDIRSLLRNINGLIVTCQKREQDILETLSKLKNFSLSSESVQNDLIRVIEQIKAKELKTVKLGSLVDMQSDLKKFRKTEIHPLHETTQHVNSVGYDLIYTAHQTVRIQHISDQLKAIDQLWNELNDFVASHDSKIQKALIKCGQLKDVLESYIAWLKNVELMVSQQQLPTWEYSVIAIQQEEHKAMQDMLEKEHDVLVSLIAQCSDNDQDLTEEDQNQLKLLSEKWTLLWAKMEARSKNLMKILSEARIFNGLANRFEKWLRKVEKQSFDVVFSGNLHDRIEKEILHQQAVMRDIKHHEIELNEIESTPLKDMLGDDDINLQSLENFIDHLRSKYNEVARYVSGRCGTLEENKKLSHLFNDRLLNLFAFVTESNMKLSRWEDADNSVHTLDAKPTFVNKSIQACQAILQDVTDKNSMLDAATRQGRELLSKCGGDDNHAAHKKLDSLSVEFNLLMTRATRISEKLCGMLAVSTELESVHQKFREWLQSSTKLLLDMESRDGMSLDEWEQVLQELQPMLLKPTLEVIRVNASKLSSLSMWWGTQLLSKLYGYCQTQFETWNKRYDSHCNAVEVAKQDLVKLNEHLDLCYLLLEKLSNIIEDLETLHSFDQANLLSKRDKEKEMQKVVLEIGEKSVKLEQDSHKLIFKLNSTDRSNIEEKMNAYRTQLKDVMDKHAFYNEHIGIAISLACKWHESNDKLESWMNKAQDNFNSIQAEKFYQMETYRQKMRNLLVKHMERKPCVENIIKCSKEIQKLLGNNTAVQDLVGKSEAKKNEYDCLTEKLEKCVNNSDKLCNTLEKVLQEMENTFKTLSSLLDELNHLCPVSLDIDSIAKRKLKIEAIGAEKCMEDVNIISKMVENLNVLLADVDHIHLNEGILVRLGALQDLKKDIESSVTQELSKLELEMKALLQFSKYLEIVSNQLETLCESIKSIIVQRVLNPERLIQQTQQLETLTEELHETVDLQNKLQTVADECKSVPLQSGNESSYVDREMQEVSVKLENVQGLLEKVKMDFNEALEYAIHFHKISTDLKQFFSDQCERIDKMPLATNDLDLIKEHIELLKTIRLESTPHQIEAKKLCSNAFEVLTESDVDTTEQQQQEVMQLQNSSDLLDEKLLQTQIALDQALLDVGELQHAIDEMVQWSEVMLSDLSSQQERVGACVNDSKLLELEQAKIMVTTQDVAAHEASFMSIMSKFDNAMNMSTDSCVLMGQDIDKLKTNWQKIQELILNLNHMLEKCLETARKKEAELSEIDFWIDEQLANLSAASFFGGLPETAQQQLDLHNSFILEVEKKKTALENLVKSHNVESGDVACKMNKLSLQAHAKGEKLQEALQEAKAFHESLQNFTSWLGQAEKTLETFKETNHTWLFPNLNNIFEEQKNFEIGVTEKRTEVLALDKAGSHLKYFSQKQDGILIKNLLLSVHSRWDKLVSETSSRSISLADIHKKSKQFHDDYEKLMDWIEQAKHQLGESQSDLYVDAPDLVQTELENYKEFQRALHEKQPVYDGVNRSGGVLSERVTLQSDKQSLETKLKQLKREWNSINETSVQRKNQLEESLLFSGRFIEAIESLLHWLCKIEPEVNTQTPLQGDIHTVDALMDRHNILHNEFNARHANVESLQQSVNRGQGDSWITHQLQELLERWNDVSKKISHKQECLEDALCKAKKLHSSAKQVLEDLSAVEKYLQLQQKFPDDEFQLEELRASYQTLNQELLHKEIDKSNVISLASSILNDAHPDALTPVRQLMTVVQTKWDQIKVKNHEYGVNLNKAMEKLKQDTEKMRNLESWLTKAEEDLRAKENLHITTENIKRLTNEHDAFHKDMVAYQPDYEMLMNLYSKRKASQPKRKDGKKSPREQDESPMQTMFNNTHSLWQKVWLKALEHERKLQEAKENIRRSDQQQKFDFDEWRKRYMKWMKHKRARVMDFFRELDKDGTGQITRQQFIQEILKSKFQTDEAEMTKVADVFDKDGDGYIDYYEFIAALYPARDTYKPESDADKIDDEVIRQVAKCTCCKKFKVEQIAENKYKFGDNQQLRLVRILRSTVMVRVGGGWMALDEFLIKNDPCRAKGRTNSELREKFILPSGASQAMTPFRTKRTPVKSPQKQSRASPSSSHSETSSSASKHTSPAKSVTSRDKALHETPKRTSKIPTKDRTPKR